PPKRMQERVCGMVASLSGGEPVVCRWEKVKARSRTAPQKNSKRCEGNRDHPKRGKRGKQVNSDGDFTSNGREERAHTPASARRSFPSVPRPKICHNHACFAGRGAVLYPPHVMGLTRNKPLFFGSA